MYPSPFSSVLFYPSFIFILSLLRFHSILTQFLFNSCSFFYSCFVLIHPYSFLIPSLLRSYSILRSYLILFRFNSFLRFYLSLLRSYSILAPFWFHPCSILIQSLLGSYSIFALLLFYPCSVLHPCVVLILSHEMDRKIDVTAIQSLLVQNRQQTHDWTLIGSGANGIVIQVCLVLLFFHFIVPFYIHLQRIHN